MIRYTIPFLLQLFVCSNPVSLYAQQGISNSGSASVPGFKENKGQIRSQSGQPRADIDFQLLTAGMSVFIGNGSIHYQWNKVSGTKVNADGDNWDNEAGATTYNTYRLDVTFPGCNPEAKVLKENVLPGTDILYTNGLDGLHARSFTRIVYQDIYPGIDWVIYTKDHTLKYDFIIHAGADVSNIKMHYSGATALSLKDGALEAVTPMGIIREQKPFSYVAETKEPVSSAFVLQDNILSFKADPCRGTLVIDPLIDLEWATYYGGSGLESSANAGTYFYSMTNTTTTDKEGNVYLCGATDGISNIATQGSYQVTFSGGEVVEEGTESYIVYGDVFLVKFDSTGQRIWATYYGGERNEHTGNGHSVACDTFGNIYWAGSSNSTNGIATAGAHQQALFDPESYKWKDNFLVKFDSAGQRQWATYYGGRGHEEGGSVVISPDGRQVYLCASATSYENIATAGSEITTAGNSPGILWNTRPTGYIARFDNTGALIWASYIGNRESTNPVYDALMDATGRIYVTGWTQEGLPGPVSIATPGSFQPVIGGGPDPRPSDAFLQQWDSTGNRNWGTFYGGSSSDMGFGIASDEQDNVYMAGYTTSSIGNIYGTTCIATPGSMQTLLSAGGKDGFLVKFNSAGQRLWGTYYGIPEAQEEVCAIAYTEQKLYLLGSSRGKNYGMATDCAFQELSGGGPAPTSAFIAQFTTDGIREHCTYYGGQGIDLGYSIAIDRSNPKSIYIAGYTASAGNIATAGSFQQALGGPWDAYLAKFRLPAIQTFRICFQDSLYIAAKNTAGVLYQWNNGVAGIGQWVSNSGRYWVRYEEKPGCLTTDSFDVHIYPVPVVSVGNACGNNGIAQATVSPSNKNTYTYIWSDAAGNELRQSDTDHGDFFGSLSPGHYTLHVRTPIGCDTLIPFDVEDFPDLALNVSGDTSITARETAQLRAWGATTYRWQPETGLDNPYSANPVAKPEQSVTYTVTGWNEYGCSAQKTVHVEVLDRWFIPNVFSPNGDGLNDVFKIYNLGYRNIEVFQVYNRWGQMVFSGQHADAGWDGTFKGQPSETGVYHYYLRLSGNDGNTQTFKGDVSLIR